MYGTWYPLIMSATATGIMGGIAGALGTYAVLRQQSLLGDAMSHAALPGIALAFMLTGTNSTTTLLVGGAVSSLIGAYLATHIPHITPLKKEAALGIILSTFFGCGLVLITYLQNSAAGHQSVINKFLFGNAATLLQQDLWMIFGLAVITVITISVCYKEFKAITFDKQFARMIGIKTTIVESILTTLLICTLILGLQMIGVILMSSMLIAPAAAARQWCISLKTMMLTATIIGATSSILGAIISSCFDKIPTGPAIVVIVCSIVFVSLIIAPSRSTAS